jgi:nitrogen-specific signal transduction histidine kinase
MSQPEPGVTPAPLPREFVHELRNALGVAVGTADLLMLQLPPGANARDVDTIRDACLRIVRALDEWETGQRLGTPGKPDVAA